MNNMKELKKYQELALEKMLSRTRELFREDKKRRIVFQSPTGSGKTFVMSKYIEAMVEEFEDEDLCFLWISIGKGSLHIQSQESLKSEFDGFPECHLLEEEFFGTKQEIDKNEVVVVNWEKLNSKDGKTGEWKNKVMRDSEKVNFREAVRETRENGKKIIMIIDESHAGLKTARGFEIIDEIVQPFLSVEMSATPVLEGDYEPVKVDPTDVIRQGMIKREIIINEGLDEIEGDEKTSQEIILGAAYRKRLELKEMFKKEGVDINPLVLIQLPTGEAAEDKRDFVERFLANKGISFDDKNLAVWLSEEKINNEKEVVCPNNSGVDFLIFKQAIDTGWDCPRAHILVRFREKSKNPSFEIQLVGRILRMPEAKHYLKDDLNTGFVYTNVLSIDVKKEKDDAMNIIKSKVSKRKDIYKPLNLRSFYKNRLDFGDVTSSFYKFMDGFFGEYFKMSGDAKKNRKILLEKGIDLEKVRASDEIILDEHFDVKYLDEETKEKHLIKGEKNINLNLSEDDKLNAFNNLVKENLLGFAYKRSAPIVKSSLYVSFEKYLGMKMIDNGIPMAQGIILNNSGLFGRFLNECLDGYKVEKDKEIKKKSEKASFDIMDWEIEERRNFNPNEYKKFDFDLSLYEPSYLNFDSGIEEEFLKFLEKHKDKISWWWQNGNEHMQSNFGIKYEIHKTVRTFQPDFLIMFKDGRLGIFDTKAKGFMEDENKAKGEALQNYVVAENKNGKKLVGGIIIFENGKFRLNMNKKYLSAREDSSEWGFFEDLFENDFATSDSEEKYGK